MIPTPYEPSPSLVWSGIPGVQYRSDEWPRTVYQNRLPVGFIDRAQLPVLGGGTLHGVRARRLDGSLVSNRVMTQHDALEALVR